MGAHGYLWNQQVRKFKAISVCLPQVGQLWPHSRKLQGHCPGAVVQLVPDRAGPELQQASGHQSPVPFPNSEIFLLQAGVAAVIASL